MKTAAINNKPWNLIEEHEDDREKFNNWITERFVTDENKDLDLKTGDKVIFLAGYDNDIQMISEILGFDKDGHAYLLWDCYWFAVNLPSRSFQKI